MSSAVPPSRLSRSTQFQHGVTEAARGGMYIAALRLHKPGDEKTVIVEHLGATHPNPWLAAVVHDAALCKRAFDLGKLQSLQHGPAPESNAAATERLNFPLSAYTSQQAFWDALEGSSFGQLSLQLQANNRLEKTLFFGDTWRDGLAEERLAEERRRREQQHQQQHKREPAAGAAPRNGSSREWERRREQQAAAQPAGAAKPEQDPGAKRRRLSPPAEEERQRGQQGPASKSQQQMQQPQPSAGIGLAGNGKLKQDVPAAKGAAAAPLPQAARDRREETAAAAPAEAPAPPPAAAVAAPHTDSTSSSEPILAQRAGKLPVVVDLIGSSGSEGEPSMGRGGAGPAPPAANRAAAGATPSAAQQMQQAQQPQQRPAQEPRNVWIGSDAEFPPGSGTFPMYLKAGPLDKSYYTISKSAGTALFAAGYEGDVELRDAASGRTWTVHTNLKEGRQRYITKVSVFNRDNACAAHDVLWFQAGPPAAQQQKPCVLFGIWRWGSQEAAAFAAKLNTGTKAAAKAPAKAVAAGKKPTRAPQPQQPQLGDEEMAGGQSSDSEGVVLAQRPAATPHGTKKRRVVGDSEDEEDVPLSVLLAAKKQQ